MLRERAMSSLSLSKSLSVMKLTLMSSAPVTPMSASSPPMSIPSPAPMTISSPALVSILSTSCRAVMAPTIDLPLTRGSDKQLIKSSWAASNDL